MDFAISRAGGIGAADITLQYDAGGGNFQTIPLSPCPAGLCGTFGPQPGGFPVGVGYHATTNLQATFAKSGAFTITANVDGVTSHNAYATSALTVTVPQTAATVTLSNLTQSYDGNPKPVTVTTNPAGLAVNVTYNGSATVPSAVGTYTVVATVTDPNYSGTASATLQIIAANAPDLGVTMSDGRQYVQYGKTLSYTIAVSNVGNTAISGATVTDALPSTLDVSTAGVDLHRHRLGHLRSQRQWQSERYSERAGQWRCGVHAHGHALNDPNADYRSGDQHGQHQRHRRHQRTNHSATSTTQIVIFRDGFEIGGDGANETGSAMKPVGTLDDVDMLTFNPAQAPSSSTVATWVRATDAQGREVFRVESTHVGENVLVQIVISDANGYETPGSWMKLGAQSAGLALADTATSRAVIMVGTGSSSLQAAIPSWAALPLQIYAAQ